MAREYASPELANLIAARLSPDEFERRARAPLSEAEAQEVAELVAWFTRRYPTAKERLAYARRKLRHYERAAAARPPEGYAETAKRLASAHRAADPSTLHVFLNRDPQEKEIRLLEVTKSAPTLNEPMPIGFAPRPDLGVAYGLTIVLLSLEEWVAVQAGRLALPDGWDAGRLEEL
jgi:hypothetical protein